MLTYKWRQIAFVVVGAVGLLSGHWTAETWWHWTQKEWWHEPSLAVGIAATAIFGGCPILLYLLRKAFRHPHSRLPVTETPPQREVLLWFLSALSNHELEQATEGVPPWFKPTWDLNADILELEKLKKQQPGQRWAWEMPLRGIRHHVGRLRMVLFIVSSISAAQVHWIRNFLGKYPQLKDVKFKVLVRREHGMPQMADCPNGKPLDTTVGWNFEDFNQLTTAVSGALGALGKSGIPDGNPPGGLADNKIMIDFTGGQKVTSVVAAAVTFNRPVRAQYVSTNEPWGVLGYDLQWAELRPEDFGFGE